MGSRWTGRRAARRPPAAWPVLVAMLVGSGAFVGRPAVAGIGGYLEGNYVHIDTETVDAAGRALKTRSDFFSQRYNLNIDSRIYPYLGVGAGGFFERQDAAFETDGRESDVTLTAFRPFVSVLLRNPLYTGEASYRRNEEKVTTSAPSSFATVRDTYATTFHWRPDGFPELRLEYFRANSFDKDRLFLDTDDETLGMTTRYQPVRPLDLRYQLTLGERVNHLDNTTVESLTHDARIIYGDRWWQQRMTVASDYHFIRSETEVRTAGGGEVGFRLFALAGLSAISDVPETGALDLNALLIDGDTTAGAGINLGLPPPGGDARPRNMGLDFGAETEVNTLLVTVDRDVTQVANSFAWRIYTSADNLNWVLRQTVSPAPFSSFFLRFEIRFANVTARYVKVVVAPLSPATPFASSFPTILVTELQGELRRPAADVSGKAAATTHTYNLNVRTRILDVPSLFYEFSYYTRRTDPSTRPTTYTVSNGLALHHRFTRAMSGQARATREDGRESAGHRTSYLYSASVTAVPLETLSHTLAFSGINSTVAGETTTTHSLFLYNNAKMYEGIDVNLGGGGSLSETDAGQVTESAQLTGGATLIPHSTTTLNFVYTGSTTTVRGGSLPEETKSSTIGWEASGAFAPVPAVYLFGAYRVDRRTQAGRAESDTTQNYTLTWSPFPDGTLHLSILYGESLVSQDDSRTTTILPSLRWNITRRSFLDLQYRKQKTESAVLMTDTRGVSATLRVHF